MAPICLSHFSIRSFISRPIRSFIRKHARANKNRIITYPLLILRSGRCPDQGAPRGHIGPMLNRARTAAQSCQKHRERPWRLYRRQLPSRGCRRHDLKGEWSPRWASTSERLRWARPIARRLEQLNFLHVCPPNPAFSQCVCFLQHLHVHRCGILQRTN